MTERFRALLIGVPSYKDPAIKDLPFVTQDLGEMARGLKSTGYHVDVHEPEETDRDSIDTAVEAFFQDAQPGQTLLLYLSGHGVHNQGVDYLVPKGALTRSRDFPSRCVSLDFAPYLEQSRAGDVVIFVDACREGIILREMGEINVANWSRMQVRQVSGRRVAYVYACSAGERARYADNASDSFSLFSRALSALVADPLGPRTLADLSAPLQDRLDTLTAEHSCPRQLVRFNGISGTGVEPEGFVVFERPDREDTPPEDEHSWKSAALEHEAWRQVATGPGNEALREATAAMAHRLAQSAAEDERALTGDPWRSAGFTERMSERVQWLLSAVLNPEKLALTPAEAALLVALPYAHSAYWTRVAARYAHVGPTDLGVREQAPPERRGYEQFAAGYPRLVRRAQQSRAAGDAAAADGIGWWLFHRWLVRQPEHYESGVLADLVVTPEAEHRPHRPPFPHRPAPPPERLVADVFASAPLMALVRALRAGPDGQATLLSRQVAGSTPLEQLIRQQLVADLAVVAYRFALDPTTMPQVVVEHLGISFAVDLSELHATLDGARWNPRGRTRVLDATCEHPAVGLALAEQTTALDSVLGAIDARTGQLNAPLQDLPVHVTADQVRPAANPNGRPVYEPGDLRFRLADDRIQEILMGEQLYGDPALAIRELYQNALDACRYRKARNEYLRATGVPIPEWHGEISFHQGLDEAGHAYLECRDNGIGMGSRELREVFSHAGMRFADLPDYIEERAEWESFGIRMHPNSRFGIGVLSYFMLADDITVTTCRLDREGHPGDELEVSIAGPGALFRIQNHGRSHSAGTTVRLRLRALDDPSSCTDLLRRILWYSEFTVTSSSDGSRPLRWEAGRLAEFVPLGANDPYDVQAERREDSHAAATDDRALWWCDTTGGILADGLWVGIPLFGAVVNLAGEHTPALTVDRRQALDYDRDHVDALMRAGIPGLLKAEPLVLTHAWLKELSDQDLPLSDEILRQATAARFAPWRVGGHETDITAVGCFRTDSDLFAKKNKNGENGESYETPWPSVANDSSSLSGNRGVSTIFAWRVNAWIRAGNFDRLSVPEDVIVPQAMPADALLISRDLDATSPWLTVEEPVPVGHIVHAAHVLRRTPAEINARLRELGFEPETDSLPASVDQDDATLLSETLSGTGNWLEVDTPVPMGHIIEAATQLERPPGKIAARLAELGRRPETTVFPDPVEEGDALMLSRDLDGKAPWTALDSPVPPGHIVRAALALTRTPGEIVARLRELGLRPEVCDLPESVEDNDSRILSGESGGPETWLPHGKPVPAGQIIYTAVELRRTPRQIAERLVEFGHRPETFDLPEAPSHDDVRLLSLNHNEGGPWLSMSAPVPLAHIVHKAALLRYSPARIAERLEALGYRPEPLDLPEAVDQDDARMLSWDLGESGPWLPVDMPVPYGHIIQAAVTLRRTPAAIAARLWELGHQVEAVDLPAAVEPDDTLIIGQGRRSWLDPADTVTAGQVIRAAITLRRTPGQIAERLTELGYRVEERALPDSVDRDDALLLGESPNRAATPLGTAAVQIGHIVRVAVTLQRPPAQIAERLVELGHEPESRVFPDPVDETDSVILRGDADGDGPWLTLDEPVATTHILEAAQGKRSPVQVVERLREFGFTVTSSLVVAPAEGEDG